MNVHTRHKKKNTKIKQERAGGDFVCMSVIFLHSSVDSSFQRASNTCHTDELHRTITTRGYKCRRGERDKRSEREKNRHKTATTSILNINICALQKWEYIFYNANNTHSTEHRVYLQSVPSAKKHQQKNKKRKNKKQKTAT